MARGKSKSVHSGTDTKTAKQWIKEGRLLKENAVGERLYTNGFCQISAIYYGIEETFEATKEELRAVREPELSKKREYARAWRKRKRAIAFRNTEMQKAKELPSVLCVNPSKIVVFDVETTGLNALEDEILQFSACDGDGNTLLNTYLRPYVKTSWSKAESIHGISAEGVADAPYFHEVLPVIRGIFEAAEVLVTYNGEFDMWFLRKNGVEVDLNGKEYHDVMLDFAAIYGGWNEYYGNYVWQKLSTCAAYYCYEFKAHDSMEDVKATLHCWKCINSEKQ